MKINEFVEHMKKNASKATREEQILAMARKVLDAKDYISIKEKRTLIDSIINSCILYDNGIYKFDGIDKYVYFTMYTIAAYTNIELSDNIYDDFDMLSMEKMLPIIICVIQKEYDDVNILLQMQCDSLLENNSVEASVGRLVEGTMDFLNDVESALKSSLDKLSDIKLDENVDFSKLLNFINKD
jgi:hypothetical protein